ncbi:efflux RND transporter permease subunit [Aminicella lysinilytica]|uniref:efflux RND transporter permease subunit n=1 Tax=Aminicella lysinilytica TaxID=433323 RepID=UPI0026EFF517|nr:MMPL family transporter [Aminicella lysinilytica]
MEKFAKGVVKHRKIIIIVYLVLMIPAVIGMVNTRINYDMLSYLPKNLDSVKGQQIMLDNFGKGAFSYMLVEDKTPAECAELQTKIEALDHVDSVLWYNTLLSTDVPMSILPNSLYNRFNKDGSTLMAIFYDEGTSADSTIATIGQVRKIAGSHAYLNGMSALVKDLKDLCEQEEAKYVAIAVICSIVIMMLLVDSFVVPFIFLFSIGMAILLNMGTNIFLGNISFITQALAAVLQLAVTMDFSIFLWHAYEEEQDNYEDKKVAMEKAIVNTLTAIVGSSLTMIAGFLALCFMTYTLGADLGIVMAKGAVFGVIGSVTSLPALLLVLNPIIEKARHRSLIPDATKLAGFIVKKSWIFIIIFCVVVGPAYYGYTHTKLYYNMGATLPKSINFMVSNEKVMNDYDIGTTHIVLAKSNLSAAAGRSMADDIQNVKGVKDIVSYDYLLGNQIPQEALPSSIANIFKSGKYQIMLINTTKDYGVATSNVNKQLTKLNSIVRSYDKKATVIGEAAGTKDLMSTTSHDFKVVDFASLIMILVILFVVLRSWTLPIILEVSIYFAILINLGIPFYTGTTIVFIAPIVLSTIQLGSTINYAILLTTRYKRERLDGNSSDDSLITSISTSLPSIVTSAVGFFGSTFGVSLYSDIDIISSLCALMARGAIVSMFAVIFVLPAFLKLFDKLIIKSTKSLRLKYGKTNKKEVATA